MLATYEDKDFWDWLKAEYPNTASTVAARAKEFLSLEEFEVNVSLRAAQILTRDLGVMVRAANQYEADERLSLMDKSALEIFIATKCSSLFDDDHWLHEDIEIEELDVNV